jgi:putative ATP-binding cassette transporter
MSPTGDAAHGYQLATVAAFWRRTCVFWQDGRRSRAWFLTIGLMGVLVLNLVVQLAINHWHGWFFGALERRDAGAAGYALSLFGGLVVSVAAVGVGIVWFRETLQVRWRESVTRAVVDDWLSAHAVGRSAAFDAEANPEYRIADDVRLALEPVVDFAIGLFSAMLSLVSFLGVLWSVGGSIELGRVTIPAYMVLGAVAYGVTASVLMVRIGRLLPRRVAARNAEEARLRFALTEARTAPPGQGVPTYGSARRQIHATTDEVVRRWLAVVTQNARITWITNGSSALIPIVPLLLAAPKYFAGEFGIGQVVQLAAAFVAVQTAISWLVDNYRRIAECYASVARVVELDQAIFGRAPPRSLDVTGPVDAAVTP